MAAHDARLIAGSLALTLALWLAPSAVAASSDPCAAPPGTAAVEQYCESTPGSVASPPTGRSGAGEPAASIPPATAARVREARGGAAVLDGLQAAPPARGKPADGQGEVREDASQPRRSGAADGAEPAPSGSLAGVWASADSIWSEDMRGIMAILAVTLLGGVALGLRRRSRTGV